MGLIVSNLLSILDTLIAFAIMIVAPMVTDDIKAWLPRVTERFTDKAVKRLPRDQRDRFAEEWRSYVADTPGDISKLIAAVGFLRASTAMASATRATVNGVVVHPIERFVAFVLLIFFAPMMAIIAILIKLDGGPVFFRQKKVYPDGKVIESWRFRTLAVPSAVRRRNSRYARGLLRRHRPRLTPVGRFLRYGKLHELPELIDILRGQLNFPRNWKERFFLLPANSVNGGTQDSNALEGEMKIQPRPTDAVPKK